MKLTATALALMALGSSAFAADNNEAMRNMGIDVQGYVSHGINTFNGKGLSDYSKVTPSLIVLHVEPKLKEIGFYDPGQPNSGTIVASTDRNLLVATNRAFMDFVRPRTPLNPAWVNVPLGKIGSNFFGSTSAGDRVIPLDFSKAGGGEIYRQKGVNHSPTIGQWEKISGLMTMKNNRDGTSVVSITIRNAFPNAVYTLWDVGAKAPLTSKEAMIVVPMGGIPNIMVTDAQGCGYKKVAVPHQLNRPCAAGASSCTAYVLLAYHWDGQTYGASPDAGGFGAPVGLVASNHITFPTNGTRLQEPATRFPSRHHGCNIQ